MFTVTENYHCIKFEDDFGGIVQFPFGPEPDQAMWWAFSYEEEFPNQPDENIPDILHETYLFTQIDRFVSNDLCGQTQRFKITLNPFGMECDYPIYLYLHYEHDGFHPIEVKICGN